MVARRQSTVRFGLGIVATTTTKKENEKKEEGVPTGKEREREISLSAPLSPNTPKKRGKSPSGKEDV